jgi:hypothetical protein
MAPPVFRFYQPAFSNLLPNSKPAPRSLRLALSRMGWDICLTPTPVFLQNAEMEGLAGGLLQNAHFKEG